MNKFYAISDLHGDLNLCNQVLDFIDTTDKVFFLGDAIDRGPDGIEVFNKLWFDDRVTYIKGNHEQILEDLLPEILDSKFSCLSLWEVNGGRPTMNTLSKMNAESAFWYVTRTLDMPLKYELDLNDRHIILTHAGFSPWQDEKFHDYLWDRYHLQDNWEPGYENVYIVHGHTPVCSSKSPRYQNPLSDCEIVTYADGHKIDIDLGTFLSFKTCLLDLETFEPIYFYSQKED